MQITIRKAKCSDISDIININKSSLPVVYNKIEWIQFIVYDHVFIALHKDKPISYIATGEEGYKYHPYKKLHIISFATYPKYRSKGVGGKLLKYIINNFSELPITLNVMCSNDRAIKLYKSYGFIDHKFLKNYYGVNEDGIQFIIKK
jgi:ribosomal protein S18 acetylase RimI-like enzyme